MKFLFCLSLLLSLYSCNSKESLLTKYTWVLKDYNSTIESKKTKSDKENYQKTYKYDCSIIFSLQNKVSIYLEDKEQIKLDLNWKWQDNKETILIYRESHFENLSKLEIPFYGKYFVSTLSKKQLKLIRIIVPFEDDEEFIFEN